MRKAATTRLLINTLVSMGLISHVITPTSALAAEEFSLSVEPSVASLTLEAPYTQKHQGFTLTNNTTESQTIRFQVFPIKEIDRKTNRLIYQPISSLTPHQQSFYENAISFEKDGRKIGEITLAPEQSQTVDLMVTYPQNQQIGEYYFTVGFISEEFPSSFEPETEEIRAVTKLRGAVGTHVLISLGERTSDLVVREFSTDRITSDTTPSVTLRLENTAEKHTKVYSTVTITNMLGSEIVSGSLPDTYLLGKQVKKFDIDSGVLEPKESFFSLFKVGFNSIRIDLYDTEAGKRISRTIYFLSFPLKEVAVMIAAFIFLAYIRLRIKRKRVSA